MALAIRG